MKKGIENLTTGKLICNAAIFWLCGWFIFVVIEVILKLIKGSSPWIFITLPWAFMFFLFTTILYIVVGTVGGFVLGGVTALLLKLVRRWQKRVETLPFIMACCITTIILLYTCFFIYERFLPLYPNLSRILVNLPLITLSLIFLSALYMILARIIDKTRLISSYLALSITIYTFMIGGLYINKNLLSGKFFDLDAVRILTNSGILISSIILYVIIYRIFIFAGNRAVEIRKYVSLKAAIIIGTLLLTVGGTILSIKMYPPLNKPMAKSNNQAEDKPNIMLITMDTTRADHLSCYGYHKNTTPHLDKLAQEAVVFKNAYAPSPWTLPSHASILTGIYPAQHGAHWDDESVKANWPAGLAEQYKTLTEILVDNDYKTAGVIGAPFCHSSFGLAQGFKYYDDALVNVIPDLEHFTLFKILSRWFLLMDIATKKGLNGCRIASQINKLVFSWLDKHSQDPFFLFIHYYDPHAPYLPPDEYSSLFREDEDKDAEITESEKRKKQALSQYDGEIAYLDDQMGKLFEKLKELKIYDSTMIIITSDHGEFFGEHECWTHGYELYQEVIKVPLIIKYPSNYVKTGVYQERVSLVDIMPTILYVLGLPIPKEVQGAALCEGESKVMAEVYRHAYRSIPEWELKFARDLQSLYLGNYKYIKDMNGQGELYDIVNDPRELRNLINIMPEEAEKMELKLTEWLPYVESHLSKKEVKLDKATEETLRALGYLQ